MVDFDEIHKCILGNNTWQRNVGILPKTPYFYKCIITMSIEHKP